ncbi:hypothetical protein BBI11_06255 [Planococcus maritimus]|nr:hypothetical protein BBI11_06255 [Planococcus maritimus]
MCCTTVDRHKKTAGEILRPFRLVLKFVTGLAVIAVALMLLFDFLSASGTLFRGQVLEEFDYVLNHFYQLLFVIVL